MQHDTHHGLIMESSPSLSTISSQADYDKSPMSVSMQPSTDDVNAYVQKQGSNTNLDAKPAQSAPAGLTTSSWSHSPVLPSTPPKDGRNGSAHSSIRNASPHRTINGMESGAQRTVKFANSPQYAPPPTAAQKRGLDLKARLYDRPQDAQVFQTIRPAANRRPKTLNEAQVRTN